MTALLPYIWRWGTCGGKYPEMGKRKGHACRVVARGGMNTVLVEFVDGYRATVSANGIRKRIAGEVSAGVDMTRNTSRIHYIKHLEEKRAHDSPGYASYVEIVEIEVDGRTMNVTQEVIEAAQAYAIAVETFKETV